MRAMSGCREDTYGSSAVGAGKMDTGNVRRVREPSGLRTDIIIARVAMFGSGVVGVMIHRATDLMVG